MRKKVKIIVMLALIFFGFGIGSSYADWYDCTVTTVGPVTGTVFIRLTAVDGDAGAFTNRWFKVTANLNQNLATALTAVAMNGKLQVNLPTTNAYETISNLYLLGN